MSLEIKHLAPYENKFLESLNGEYWSTHPTYTDVRVSSLGRISSTTKYVKGRYGNTVVKKGKILSQRINSKGYLDCGVTHSGKTKTIRSHKLVAETFIPNPNNKPQVNHKNGIKTDNCVENLEWATSLENVRHAWRTGLNREKTDILVKKTISYIKSYLDFRLQVLTPIGVGTIHIDNTCFRIKYNNGCIENLVKSIRTWRDDFKLIVRGMSDLTKEIEHNRERFVPYDRIQLVFGNTPQFNEYVSDYIDTHNIMNSKCEYVCVQKLLSWHFDVFGLIDKGLAIDINTL